MDMAGRTLVVTGGTRGLGAWIVAADKAVSTGDHDRADQLRRIS